MDTQSEKIKELENTLDTLSTEKWDLLNKIDELKTKYNAETYRTSILNEDLNSLKKSYDRLESAFNHQSWLNSRQHHNLYNKDSFENEPEISKLKADLSAATTNEKHLAKKTLELHEQLTLVTLECDALKKEKDENALTNKHFLFVRGLISITENINSTKYLSKLFFINDLYKYVRDYIPELKKDGYQKHKFLI